jgi:PST family polysaccharide transporter
MWSLVIGYLVEAALDTILLLVARPPRVRPRIDKQPLRELIGFGSGHTLAAFANYFATQGDNIVVGRYLGAGMLGIYDRAYVLMRFPATVFTTVAGSVLFSAFARLQDDPQRLGVAYRRVLFACAIILLPAAAGLIVLAPEIIAILLGPDWDSVILPFQILAGSMLFRTTYKVSGIVARSAGAVLRIALYQVAYGAAVIGGAVLVIGDHGIAGVAVTTSIAVAFHFTNLSRVALAQVDLGWGTLVAAHRDGLVMAALAAAGAWPVAHFMRDVTGIAPTVIAATIAGALPALAFAAIRIRARAEDWLWLVDRVRSAGRKKTKKSVGEAPVDADV